MNSVVFAVKGILSIVFFNSEIIICRPARFTIKKSKVPKSDIVVKDSYFNTNNLMNSVVFTVKGLSSIVVFNSEIIICRPARAPGPRKNLQLKNLKFQRAIS